MGKYQRLLREASNPHKNSHSNFSHKSDRTVDLSSLSLGDQGDNLSVSAIYDLTNLGKLPSEGHLAKFHWVVKSLMIFGPSAFQRRAVGSLA